MTDRPSDERDPRAAREAASIRELEAGRLPLRAQERLATIAGDHAFTSDLSVAEHHVVRSVGFVPVGQVLGCSVYRIGYSGTWDCGFRGVSTWGGGGTLGGYGYGAQARATEATPLRRALMEAKSLAVRRLELEATALGADGVVAVRFSERHVQPYTTEFEAIGTAVRSTGPTHLRKPFTSDLSGQDFALLIRAGWAPTALVFGAGIVVRHDDYATRAATRSWSNTEISGYTELLHESRAMARHHLARDAAATGGQGLVLQASKTGVGEHECQVSDGRDHIAQTHLVGTAVVRVPASTRAPTPGALTIMRLRDNRTDRPTHRQQPGEAR